MINSPDCPHSVTGCVKVVCIIVEQHRHVCNNMLVPLPLCSPTQEKMGPRSVPVIMHLLLLPIGGFAMCQVAEIKSNQNYLYCL